MKVHRFVYRCASFCMVLAVGLTQMPVHASVIVPKLGNWPVVPNIQSTGSLRAHSATLLEAARRLDLTEGERTALEAELRDPRVLQYGLIPRRLDAMTSGPAPFHVLRDVIIPANEYGWHLVFSHGSQRTDFYIPNACGNVSFVRSRIRVAVHPAQRKPFRFAAPAGEGPSVAIAPVTRESVPAAPASNAAPAAVANAAPAPAAPNTSLCHRGIMRELCWFVPACIVGSVLAGGFHTFCGIGPHFHDTPAPHPKPTHTPLPVPSPTGAPAPAPPTPKPTEKPTPIPTSGPTAPPSPPPGCATPTPSPSPG